MPLLLRARRGNGKPLRLTTQCRVKAIKSAAQVQYEPTKRLDTTHGDDNVECELETNITVKYTKVRGE